MRIIAGAHKGRKLNAPRDYQVRPTADKVKEALFSIIQNHVPGSVVCDLFAGTGTLGLEALSRGARKCYFGDHAGESIKLVRDNVKLCGEGRNAVITHGDYQRTLDNIDEEVDVFLLDPPYDKQLLEQAIEEVSERQLLAQGGIVVAEHSRDHMLPDTLGRLEKKKEKRYGTVVLSIFM